MKAAAISMPDEEFQPLVWGAYNAFAYVPTGMPPASYPLLHHLVSHQEPGGRIIATHDQLASQLGTSRTLITRGMQHLMFARIVARPANGVYQLHPMFSGFRTPVEQLQAIEAVPEEDRIDLPDFEERYQERVAEHKAEKKRRTSKAPVADLDVQRRRKLGIVEN